MNAIQLIGVAGSLSFLAGWRLYATIAATGLGMRFGLLHLPDQIHALAVLANPWVIGVALLGATAEFFADKVMWLDSLWDAAHTVIRPLGGAILALAVVDTSNPAWQVVVFLLGGGAALLSHGAKSGTRALVNVSPEPFSNLALSTVEDGASLSGLWLAIAHPTLAIILAATFAVAMWALVALAWRLVHGVKRRLTTPGASAATGRRWLGGSFLPTASPVTLLRQSDLEDRHERGHGTGAADDGRDPFFVDRGSAGAGGAGLL